MLKCNVETGDEMEGHTVMKFEIGSDKIIGIGICYVGDPNATSIQTNIVGCLY